MTWRFLFEEGLKKKQENNSAEGSEMPTAPHAAGPNLPNGQDEAYQKKLFENDLYVWSLLLLRKDDM